MFERSFKVATAFVLLLAGYAGYVRLFAFVAARVRPAQTGAVVGLVPRESRTMREAINLARQAFGPGHWAADRNLAIRFYNAERGYWMYARSYKRLNDGRLLEFEPFALIWRSRDKKDLKTATSEKARITLDQPLGLAVKPGASSALHVVNAKIEGDVQLRDDKGTPANPDDDLVIGPMTYIEYDEPTLRIKSESDVVIQDRDMRITGTNLLIHLRPKEEGAPGGKLAGFNGAQTAFLKKNVHIVIKDVGGTGILPGAARPGQKQGARTPLDLRCAGVMRLDLPKPRVPVRVGPPAPPGPTFAEFSKIVEVARGKLNENPDLLFCDNLRLVLVPAPKPAADEAEDGGKPKAADTNTKVVARAEVDDEGGEDGQEESTGGPLTDLTLRRAEATGHSVQLLSPSQGLKIRGNELIHDKRLPKEADKTYFRGDRSTLLQVEKVDITQEGPDKGKVQSITFIRTIDATVFEDSRGSDYATIVARGPGLLETRPALDKPVERTASWQDTLDLQTEDGPDKKPRKKITLTGLPRFNDIPAQTTLDARHMAVILLRPKSKPAAPANAPASNAQPAPASESFEIENLVALDDVHLKAPGDTLTARERLDAEFVAQPALPAPAQGSVPAAAPVRAADTPPAGAAEPQPGADTPAAKPDKPNSTATANRVWAQVIQRPGTGPTPPQSGLAGQGGLKGEVQKVYLRGEVSYHQDPAPGEPRGTDVTGEAIDLFNQGNSQWKFLVYHRDPTNAQALAAQDAARDEVHKALIPPARAVTKEMDTQGEIIGLDQQTDQAWVEGPGTLILMTDRGLMSGEAPANAPAAGAAKPKKTQDQTKTSKDPAKAKKIPLTITWRSGMQFFGQSTDPNGRPTAKAEFFTDVRAEMEDRLLVCQNMKTYMDKPVKLARPKRDPRSAADGKGDGDGDDPPVMGESKADIALIECYQNVTAITRKVDPVKRVLLQQQRIEGDFVTYDKRSGDFHVPGAGVVYFYDREGEGSGPQTPAAPRSIPNAPHRRVLPMANPGRGPVVVGRNGTNRPPAAAGTALKEQAPPAPAARPLTLTQIKFSDQMKGRLLVGKDADRSRPNWADFFGNVEAIHARVANERERINPDRPPAGYSFMTAQTMRVIGEPPPPGAPETAPSRFYLTAWENAYASREDMTIQADKITYDSSKELYYAYAEENREVVLAQQKYPGQPPSISRGRTAMYNHKTGEARLDDPKAVQFVQFDTGARPTEPPKPKPDPPKPGRRIKLPARSTMERRGFNGR